MKGGNDAIFFYKENENKNGANIDHNMKVIKFLYQDLKKYKLNNMEEKKQW